MKFWGDMMIYNVTSDYLLSKHQVSASEYGIKIKTSKGMSNVKKQKEAKLVQDRYCCSFWKKGLPFWVKYLNLRVTYLHALILKENSWYSSVWRHSI